MDCEFSDSEDEFERTDTVTSLIPAVEESSLQCCVCKRPSSCAHRCLQCKKPVHAICGKNPDGLEGFGVPVLCNICQAKEKQINDSQPRGVKRTNNSTGDSDKEPGNKKWWLQQPKPSKINKGSSSNILSSDKKKWGICVTCFRTGESPKVYQLCRSNKTSIKRHAERRHDNNLSQADVRSYYDSDETVRMARKKCEAQKSIEHPQKVDTVVRVQSAPNVNEGSALSNSLEETISGGQLKTYLPEKVQTKLSFNASCSEEKSSVNQGELTNDASLHAKVDTLINEFKQFKIKSLENDRRPNSILAVDGKSAEETAELLLQWPDVRNIVDLVRVCKHIRFFSGNEEQKILSVVRCETCFDYIKKYKLSGSSMKVTAMDAAKKGLAGFSGSLATGLLYPPEKTSLLLEGGNQEFYKLKNTVKTHVTLAGGQLHFEALQYQHECRRREERGLRVTKNLVSIALTVVKAKSAATHYETMVASHSFTGSDVGELGHSRKQFSAILRAAELWCDRQVADFLSTPLPSTKLPPHYYVTCDKSTPNRISNQAILLCPMVDGNRKAIAVSSQEVYKKTDANVDGDVSGAHAPELAKTLFDEIRQAYPTVEETTLKGAWMGTVCDGAYATAVEFERTLATLLDQEKYDSSFFSVLWDPSHFLDLAFSDVFDGKHGTSEAFVKQLVERTCVVHRIFQRGKMLKHAMVMRETEDELVLKLTSRTCSTRFTTSQYMEFQKLLESLPLFIKTFREFQFSEIKEYQIAGDDFLLDLCGVCDIMKPLMLLLVSLQDLNVPCWKLACWWPRLESHLKSMLINLSVEFPTSLLPLLKKHSSDILSRKFKGTKLVQGWKITSTVSSQDDEGHKTTVDNWAAREKHDVEQDLKAFLSDLIDSCNNRINNCSNELMSTLTCLDLDTIFSLLCGERLTSGKIKLAAGEESLEQYGKDQFNKLFAYVCSLDHIQKLRREHEETELLFDAVFAHIIWHKIKQSLKTFLWKRGGYPETWFSLPSIAPNLYGPLVKLEVANNTYDEEKPYRLGNVYSLTFGEVTKPILAELDEEAVYHSIYGDERLFQTIGIEGCVTIDIALAKGGTEAVVESFYSVMKSQQCTGGQSNEVLSLRTKLDWCMPPVLQGTRAVKEIAQIYLDGDKDASLPKHSFPILGDRAKFAKEGKVLKRLRTENVRLPFLL